MLKVCEQKCNECLFSKNRIVSKERTKEIIVECLEEDRYFVCHKATNANKQVVCRGFYEKFGLQNGTIRVCDRNDWVQFVNPTTGCPEE
jgi:hypothetical protein